MRSTGTTCRKKCTSLTISAAWSVRCALRSPVPFVNPNQVNIVKQSRIAQCLKILASEAQPKTDRARDRFDPFGMSTPSGVLNLNRGD